MKESKWIAKAAEKMVKLEKEISSTSIDDYQRVEKEMKDFAATLTPEQVFAIDDYIQKHKLLTK